MRSEFAQAIIDAGRADPRIVFLTGDLGFMAMEPVRDALGERFVNVGVAEQNMIGVAAGLAAQGLVPWVYSIAPFATLRPYEQIRNDICLHRLPVKIVGNGGGYGYGIMGSTHHVLQDIGAMRMLPDMTVYVPLLDQDVKTAVAQMMATDGPGYLRLNLGAKKVAASGPFSEWRRLAAGTDGVVISTGPVVDGLLDVEQARFKGRLEVWSVGKFPFGAVPDEVSKQVANTGRLMTIEEHCGPGGLGEAVAGALFGKTAGPVRFQAITARGYPSGRYGSQSWHQSESGLCGPELIHSLEAWLDGGNSRPTRRVG